MLTLLAESLPAELSVVHFVALGDETDGVLKRFWAAVPQIAAAAQVVTFNQGFQRYVFDPKSPFQSLVND